MSCTSPSPWHLENHLARLRIDGLAASLDLLRPGAGLMNWDGLGERLSSFRILAIEMPALRAGDPQVLAEAYSRGPDLIAAYRATADWPVFLHAMWKALAVEQSPGILAALDLIVSARTELLDARPELSVRAVLPAGGVLRLSNEESAAFQPWGPVAGESRAALPSEGPACVLFRPRSSHLSYAEMVHPADFSGSELIEDDTAGRHLAIHHRLFVHRLEKGVLLRARVRGLLLAREDDAELAAASYRGFAGLGPPLGA